MFSPTSPPAFGATLFDARDTFDVDRDLVTRFGLHANNGGTPPSSLLGSTPSSFKTVLRHTPTTAWRLDCTSPNAMKILVTLSECYNDTAGWSWSETALSRRRICGLGNGLVHRRLRVWAAPRLRTRSKAFRGSGNYSLMFFSAWHYSNYSRRPDCTQTNRSYLHHL